MTLKLKMPSADEARQVVEDMYAAKKYGGSTWGKKGVPAADFSALSYPIYLPILVERASKGEKEALDGMRKLPTPEATEALLKLLAESTTAPFTVLVAQTLLERMPHPERKDKIPGQLFGPRQPNAALVQKVWRPEFNARARDEAFKLLSTGDRNSMLEGARMLQCVAGKDDLPKLKASLDNAVVHTKDTLKQDYGYPEPVGVASQLLSACFLVMPKDAIPSNPVSAGEKLLFVSAMKTDKEFKPNGWEQKCEMLLQDPLPFLRAKTLESLPSPLPASLATHIPRLLEDNDIAVRCLACNIAATEKNPAWKASLLKSLVPEGDEWLLRSATEAALNLGARLECAEFWLKSMNSKKTAHESFLFVVRCVSGVSFSGGFNGNPSDEMLSVYKQRWTRFIDLHRDALKNGRQFALGDPELSADLIPPGFQCQRKNEAPWPPKN